MLWLAAAGFSEPVVRDSIGTALPEQCSDLFYIPARFPQVRGHHMPEAVGCNVQPPF